MKILVVDDDAITRLTVSTLLTKRGYEVTTATNGDDAYKLLQEPDAPPLAIVDWMMPGLNGLDLCRKLRESGKTPYTYVVMLSGRREKEDFIAGLEAGADEYVRKPFDLDELHARMRAAERIMELQEQLRNKAYRDDLTGAFNRAGILDILRRELAHAVRDGKPLSVMLADLDKFKSVNDTHGHLVGDAVLREVPKLLGSRLRAYDALGRYGGEEFLIVLPGCAVDDAIEVAERVRSAVAAQPIDTSAGPLEITVSVGVGVNEGQSVEPDEVIRTADEALYRAKLAGRNRVEGPERSG